MDRMKTARLLLALLAASLSPIGYAQPVQVTVLAVESAGGFKAWLGDPVDPVRAASAAAYPGRLTHLAPGRKAQLPILVTGLPAPAPREMYLVADLEILGPDGRSLGHSPRCCRAIVSQGAMTGAVLLDKWGVIDAAANTHQGSYTVRVSVTDGRQTWTTTETLPYGEGDVPGSAHETPRLRMNVPPEQRAPGGPGDRRDCLSLPTPAEVIKCAEKQ